MLVDREEAIAERSFSSRSAINCVRGWAGCVIGIGEREKGSSIALCAEKDEPSMQDTRERHKFDMLKA